MVTACATLRRDGEVARDVRLAMGAIQPRAFRVPEVEAMLEGQAFGAELLEEAVATLRAKIQVAPNFRASAEYRRDVAGTLARRALNHAFGSVEK
jgi:CO/xanthine dehydrogenase FAD-binding subunit